MDQGWCWLQPTHHPLSSSGQVFQTRVKKSRPCIEMIWTSKIPTILILQFWIWQPFEEKTFVPWEQCTQQWRKYVGCKLADRDHSFSEFNLHGREFVEAILLRLLAKKKLNSGLPPLCPAAQSIHLRDWGKLGRG